MGELALGLYRAFRRNLFPIRKGKPAAEPYQPFFGAKNGPQRPYSAEKQPRILP